jgi:hypothetical protein
MIVITKCMYIIAQRRTHRQRKKVEKKPCMKTPDVLSCAIRHTRCLECPYNNFFRPDRHVKKVLYDES